MASVEIFHELPRSTRKTIESILSRQNISHNEKIQLTVKLEKLARFCADFYPLSEGRQLLPIYTQERFAQRYPVAFEAFTQNPDRNSIHMWGENINPTLGERRTAFDTDFLATLHDALDHDQSDGLQLKFVLEACRHFPITVNDLSLLANNILGMDFDQWAYESFKTSGRKEDSARELFQLMYLWLCQGPDKLGMQFGRFLGVVHFDVEKKKDRVRLHVDQQGSRLVSTHQTMGGPCTLSKVLHYLTNHQQLYSEVVPVFMKKKNPYFDEKIHSLAEKESIQSLVGGIRELNPYLLPKAVYCVRNEATYLKRP